MADTLTPRQWLAATMFTDMVGYSALAQKNEALALALLEEYRGLVGGILFPVWLRLDVSSPTRLVHVGGRPR